MINALFSSKCGGTKAFVFEGVKFRWAGIEVHLTCSTYLVGISVLYYKHIHRIYMKESAKDWIRG